MKKTALFFGSFNPIHFGHLNVAKAAIATGIVEEVDFIVSPKNPFKREVDLLPEQQRLDLVLSVLSNEDQMIVTTSSSTYHDQIIRFVRCAIWA